MLLETVFQYRTLLGKCDLGCGLDWDEIELLGRIERSFATEGRGDGRRFQRQRVELTAVLRGDQINDTVELIDLGLGGLVCRKAPYVARDEEAEVVIDDGEHCYRFSVRGVWQRDDGDDYKVGLAFVGMPVRLHKVAVSKHEFDVVDKMLASAA